MAVYLFFLVILCFSTWPCADCVQCDGAHANQQITDNGALYWCGGDGKKVGLACLAPDASRVDIGSSHWTDTAILECRQQSDAIQLVAAACLKNGRRLEIDQSMDDGQYFYKCARSSGGVKLETTACVGADGSRVAPGGTVNQGGFVYTCNAGGAGPAPAPVPAPSPAGPAPAPKPAPQQQLTAAGCSFNGKDYKLEEDMELSGAWYKCTKDSAGTPTSVLTGCIEKGKKYKIGQTWTDEFFSFKCGVIGGVAMGTAYSCLERYPNGSVVEYSPGRKWLAGQNQYNRYVISCSQQGLQLRRRAVACYYNTNEGQGVLDAGCMKQVGTIRIQCAPPGATPNVRIRITENPNAADEQRFQTLGQRMCESKPLQSVIN